MLILVLVLALVLFLALWLAVGMVWWMAALVAFFACDFCVICLVVWRAWATRN